jgi:hypothetical protein
MKTKLAALDEAPDRLGRDAKNGCDLPDAEKLALMM